MPSSDSRRSSRASPSDGDGAQKRRARALERLRTPEGRAVKLVGDARYRARLKGLTFDLTAEHVEAILRDGRCQVSGIPLDLGPPPVGYKSNPWAPAVDRKDSRRGYTADNVQIVVNIYNRAKSEFHSVDVLCLALALAKKH